MAVKKQEEHKPIKFYYCANPECNQYVSVLMMRDTPEGLMCGPCAKAYEKENDNG